eukprot:5884116-Prymnesium_polylepis.1
MRLLIFQNHNEYFSHYEAHSSTSVIGCDGLRGGHHRQRGVCAAPRNPLAIARDAGHLRAGCPF